MANFQTGPVAVSDAVRAALAAPLVSHRSPEFIEAMDDVGVRLAGMTHADGVIIRPGGGTLANDMIAAQLEGRGLIVARGEFGERLKQHAIGAGLEYDAHDTVPITTRARWIWAVHCETSTGELADLAALHRLAEASGAKLCLDCVSSIGAVDLDLSRVHMASFASGKALASIAGVCGVLTGPGFAPKADRPRCLDMSTGVPSTFPSGPLFALRAALDGAGAERYRTIRMAGGEVRSILDGLGIGYLAHDRQAPHVVTVPVVKGSALDVADGLARRGVLVSARSDYLVRRNWLQIAVMGHDPLRGLGDLHDALEAVWPC